MKICIDCGHYAKYNQSPVQKNYWESEMTWKLGHYLGDELTKLGVSVIQTRTNLATDMALETRGKKAQGCDLFISIHSNACSTSSTDYPLACCNADKNKVSAELGLKLAQEVGTLMGCKQSARIIQRVGTGNLDWYGVLRGAKSVGVNGILLEHGFHTNLMNANWLLIDDNLKKLAKAEAEIIYEYFKGSIVTPTDTEFQPYLVKITSTDGFVNIRKTPKFEDKDIVGKIENSNIKYTIVEETTVDGVTFGKLKSGVGWIALSCTTKVV